ncbi:conserved Plasmodium protein, unknown function [Plasmodium gallinaceum]|uniref:Uncharacterized protein n=1 Tax=Plasmodium gallinaceum TaxID=5849 RepID=A0A1J1GZ95_PLAGA|nr:conserved Plasmodium protein, unknown function [Plasmodium gallinaceum]CRG96339.1 conserved Plasmodium protein, unknown function [Plasmodium gallinaceum]
MDIRHVEGCEYYERENIKDCEDEIKKVMNKLLYERKKNFQEQDNYCHNPSISICPNVYCNIYTDLYNWFGFKNCMKIDTESLNTCFTDVTNGGVGYYEKLIVLGGRILELYSELHFFNKYNYEKDEEIVDDLRNIKSIKEVVFHYLYVQKRKNRVVYRNSLYLFGYSYLYTPLFFNNKNSIIKYVKACVAYAVKFSGSNIFSWMPSLIEHIYHSQKLKVSEIEQENELIQDLQEYLGYQFDYIIPRINECFSYHNLYISNSHLTGLQIIRIFANEYFSLLADDVGVYGKEKAIWVREETEAFLNSNCIEIFSGCMISINKYLNEKNVKISKIRNIFEMILSSCWVIGKEKKNKIWVSALIQRLRQVQLLTQITTIEKWSYSIKKYNDININNFVNDIYNFNNINGSILSPFQLQNINTYLPSKKTQLKQIPYYTTLADKYKDRFHQNDNKNTKNKKDYKISNVLNSLSNNLSKHFKSRKQRINAPPNMMKIYANNGNLPAGSNYINSNDYYSNDDVSGYDVSNRDEEEIEDENNEEEDEHKYEEKKKNNKIKSKNNGIPVKIKYIKDSKDDENSKYVIEIPKKDLKGKGNKNHIKAVLWGNKERGLEIKIPTVKNILPQMKIKTNKIL